MNYQDDKEFQRCIQFVLEQECRRKKDGTLDDGYVNNPNDPGGETKYGISKKAYPNENIKNLTLDRALFLYFRDYWYVGAGCVFPLSVCALDCAVNNGTKTAKQFLGICGGDYKKFNEQRAQHYIALLHGKFANNPDRLKFQSTWFGRLNNLKKFIDSELLSQSP